MRQGPFPRTPRLALGGLAAVLVLAAGLGTASATADEEAAAACEQALLAQGATGIRDVEIRRDDRVPYVHGIADFGDSDSVRVRCRVYNGEVSWLRYLVRDPAVREGWLWTADRPASAVPAELRPGDTGRQADAQTDEAAGPAQELVAPRWRSAGETDFGHDDAAMAPASSELVSPLRLRPPG